MPTPPLFSRGELAALLLLLGAVLLAGLLASPQPLPPPLTDPPIGYLYICGDAVERPGAYPFRADRLLEPREVYLRAGGDPDLLEHLLPLSISVPQLVVFERSTLAPGGPVNINTAHPDLLESLPGIGPVLARRIVDARPFASLDELLAVEGLGELTLERLAGQISLR